MFVLPKLPPARMSTIEVIEKIGDVLQQAIVGNVLPEHHKESFDAAQQRMIALADNLHVTHTVLDTTARTEFPEVVIDAGLWYTRVVSQLIYNQHLGFAKTFFEAVTFAASEIPPEAYGVFPLTGTEWWGELFQKCITEEGELSFSSRYEQSVAILAMQHAVDPWPPELISATYALHRIFDGAEETLADNMIGEPVARLELYREKRKAGGLKIGADLVLSELVSVATFLRKNEII